MCVAQTRALFQVCQVITGVTLASQTKVYQQCWKEWADWCAQEGVPNNTISGPKLCKAAIFIPVYGGKMD